MKSISRRTVLRGAGTAIALPFLDAMVPAFTPQAKAAAIPSVRFGVVYFPNGAIMQQWTPKTVGAGFEFTPILKPLEPFKDSLVLVNNLTRSRPGSVIGDHAVSCAGFLTGVWPKRTEAEDVLANTTIDQVVAQKIGQDTPLPSLELATEDFTGYVGACSPGFSCAYMNTISWKTPTTPLPDGDQSAHGVRTPLRRIGHRGRSAARDSPRSAAFWIRSPKTPTICSALWAGAIARASATIWTTFARSNAASSGRNRRRPSETALEAPVGVPESFEEHVGLMFDLIAAAYQANVTRVFTFMMSRELSQRTYPQIGVSEQHHSVSHHQNNAEKMAQVVKINTYHVGLFAKFLETLRRTEDGAGSLLDQSLIFYGAGMGDSNGHATDPLPVVAVGGSLKGHRHIELPKRTPVGNLWRTVAAKYDTPIEHYGDSTGMVDELF